jgi:hypothetical protein
MDGMVFDAWVLLLPYCCRRRGPKGLFWCRVVSCRVSCGRRVEAGSTKAAAASAPLGLDWRIFLSPSSLCMYVCSYLFHLGAQADRR